MPWSWCFSASCMVSTSIVSGHFLLQYQFCSSVLSRKIPCWIHTQANMLGKDNKNVFGFFATVLEIYSADHSWFKNLFETDSWCAITSLWKSLKFSLISTSTWVGCTSNRFKIQSGILRFNRHKPFLPNVIYMQQESNVGWIKIG